MERDIFLFFMGTIRNKNGEEYSRGIRIELEKARGGAGERDAGEEGWRGWLARGGASRRG